MLRLGDGWSLKGLIATVAIMTRAVKRGEDRNGLVIGRPSIRSLKLEAALDAVASPGPPINEWLTLIFAVGRLSCVKPLLGNQ